MKKPHKNLEVWKQSTVLVIEIYEATRQFPHEEMYGLTNQLRRAAVRHCKQHRRRCGRQTKKEFANFLHVSQGSLSELDTQIEIASQLGFVDHKHRQTLDDRMEPIDKMITGLIRHLSKK